MSLEPHLRLGDAKHQARDVLRPPQENRKDYNIF